MAITNISGSNAFGKTKAPANNSSEERPRAQFWLNFGYMGTMPGEDGSDEDTFIGLPSGIALDTMKIDAPGQSQIRQAKVNLHAQLLESVQDMEPGEERIIEAEHGFCVQVRRVQEAAEANASTNPLIAQARSLGFAKRTA